MGFEDTFRSVAFTVDRFLTYTAHAFLFGSVAVLLLVVRPALATLSGRDAAAARDALAERLEGLVQAALVAAAIGAAIALSLQAVLVAQAQGSDLTWSSVTTVIETAFGRWYALRLPLLVGLAILVWGRVRRWAVAGTGDEQPSPVVAWWAVWALLAFGLLVATGVAGHAAVARPLGVAIANDLVHLTAGAIWFAGIVMLAVVLPEASRALPDEERLRLLAPAVARFSTLAAASIGVIAVTGVINSLLHVGNLDDLVDSGYGRTLALKIVLFVAVVGVGAVNHLVIRGRFDRALEEGGGRETRRLFRKTITAELVLGLVIIGVTGFLVGLARTKGSVDAARPPAEAGLSSPGSAP